MHRYVLTTFSLVMAIVFLTGPAVAQDMVSVTNGEWPPYFSESFKCGGVGTKICTEAFALEGGRVDYAFMPWKRALEMARMGRFDATLGWRKTEEQQKDFYYSDSVLETDIVLFHRLGSSFDWESSDDVGRMKIGATLGYLFVDVLEAAAEKNGGEVEFAPTDELNFAKLAAGRIDVFPCDLSVGYYLLRTKFLPGTADSIQHHPRIFASYPLHLLVSKKTPNARAIVERFNKGLARLRESGKYDQYMEESVRGLYMKPEALTSSQ